jgi:GNAT superfamily N-acetyltransferase
MSSNEYSLADPLPHALTYRNVTATDFEELVALRVAAMRESLERVGRFDPQRARERLLLSFYPEHTSFVVLGECHIGFFTLRPVEEGFHLDHFYIHPDHQSRGIGSQVMVDLLSRSDVRGKPVRLGALRESEANRFYQHHGFVKTVEDEWDIHYLRIPVPNED